MIRILHVVESYGGGVATALDSYVRSTPELEHHALVAVRSGDYTPSGELERFRSVTTLARGAGALGRLWRAVNNLQPDVIHAHSSFAGAYVRTGLRNRARRPIVYTPHCFAFERTDISRPSRTVFRFIERVLAHNTDTIAACSDREAELARGLGSSRLKVVSVPNVVSGDVSASDRAKPVPLRVTGMGRLSAQKGPEFFAETVREISKAFVIDAHWIGDGDAEQRRLLEQAGVQVSGWLDQAGTRRELERAEVYLHTAAWEGFPMAVLEASALGVPILVREIGPFAGAPTKARATSPAAMAAAFGQLVEGTEFRDALQRGWDEYLATNKPHKQKEALMRAYGAADRLEHE